jgi:hypothetical protein
MAVSVYCRIRPRVARADASHGQDALTVSGNTVMVPDGGSQKGYKYDRVFGPVAPQLEVFEAAGRPLVTAALAGINATCFAYGQTGKRGVWNAGLAVAVLVLAGHGFLMAGTLWWRPHMERS